MLAAERQAAEAEGVATAAELLAHWWSRPTPGELFTWLSAGGLEAQVSASLAADDGVPLAEAAANETGLLDEYERLFIGPGPVPCPPYESYWREDVPIDIRRSLMGPCTAELDLLYHELGLELEPTSGELPDHVAVELEALAYALRRGEYGVAETLLSSHLRHFLPRLCRAVGRDAGNEFYRGLAVRTLSWLGALGREVNALLGTPLEAGRG